jgi:hypothetical protein
MSAFMVDTVHIDAMLTAGLHLPARRQSRLTWYWPDLDAATDRGIWTAAELMVHADQRRHELTTDTAGRVGAMLLAENRRSVDHRYDEQELEEPYLFTRLAGTPDPVVVLKAIDCYEYQSCEHPGWRFSEAQPFCQALRALTIGHLPGYDRAPWEITDRQVFTAAAVTARAARGHRSSR